MALGILMIGATLRRAVPFTPKRSIGCRNHWKRPRPFQPLTPDEIAQVARAFEINTVEVVRLRAAVLATSIEATLMDRIAHASALEAAWLILPIIEQAMQTHAALSAVRHAPGGADTPMDHAEDLWLGPSLALIERGMLALHLCSSAMSVEERLACAHQALEALQAALHTLDDLAPEQQASTSWQYWHAEALTGSRLARARLAD